MPPDDLMAGILIVFIVIPELFLLECTIIVFIFHFILKIDRNRENIMLRISIKDCQNMLVDFGSEADLSKFQRIFTWQQDLRLQQGF